MIKCNTKQIKTNYKHYLQSSYYNLYDCYNQPSYYKIQALEYCKKLMKKYNGKSLKIIGYNSQTFSVGFVGEIDNKEAFFYITRDYDRYIFIDDLEV